MTIKLCAKRVFSGARNDVRGHRCGQPPIEGSEFCALHDPERIAARKIAVSEIPREASTAPTMSSSSQTIRQASLTWEPGTGPVRPIPYRGDSLGFITKITAKQIDDADPTLTCFGVNRLKDGKPGQRTWRGPAFHTEELLGPDLTAQLLEVLTQTSLI